MNTPTYAIHGTDRRQLKKKLAELKGVYKRFWHSHQLDKDMAAFYGGSDGYPMSDEDAQISLNDIDLQIKAIEERLAVPYSISLPILK